MKTLKIHLEKLFKECEHGDNEHRQWLKDKFTDYYNRHEDEFKEEIETEFVEELIKELPEYDIDTSMWEYNYGDCCYSAIEFLSRCIKGQGTAKED